MPDPVPTTTPPADPGADPPGTGDTIVAPTPAPFTGGGRGGTGAEYVDSLIHDDLRRLLVPADLVSPHPENPRNGDTELIIESMRRNGVYRPIYTQKSTGYALAGNHTYAALMELGAAQLPVIWLDVDDDQARRIVAVDNRAADKGGYDEQMLLDLLTSITDLEGTGYADADLDNLATILADDRWMPDDQSRGGGVDPALWPRIDMKVPPETFEKWTALLARYEGKDDADKLAAHLDETS